MHVTIRTQRRLYHAATLAAVAGLFVVGVAAWRDFEGSITSDSTGRPTSKVNPDRPTQNPLDDGPGLTLADFRDPAVAWDRPLRRPLYDPPPPPPAPEVPPPPLRIKLLGTVVEPDGDPGSQAILMTPAGQVQMHRVGAVVGDAEIVSIEEGLVRVAFHGRTLELTIEAKAR